MSNNPGMGAGFEGAVAGGALLLTLYGAVVVVASAALHVELVPHSEAVVGAILVVLGVLGGVLGAGVAKSRAGRG